MPCERCWPEDAQAAWDAGKGLRTEAEPAEESHFHVRIRVCPACSQKFVAVFTETIDWTDGEDPQYWTRAPVSAEEAAALGPAQGIEGRLNALDPRRKTLRRDFPKNAAEPRVYWGTGLAIGPHD